MKNSSLNQNDNISQSEVIKLLNDWGSKGFFRPKNLGNSINIEAIESTPYFTFRAKTQYEHRSVKTLSQPYYGEKLDNQGTPPDVWDITVDKPSYHFENYVKDIIIPHTDTVSTCARCGGDCEEGCPSCNGRGKIYCPSCSDGEIKCITCNGTGYTSSYDDASECDQSSTCFSCWGRRKIRCSDCNGSGELKCSSCKGNGKIKCRTCEAQGKVRKYKILHVLFDYQDHSQIIEAIKVPNNKLSKVTGNKILNKMDYCIRTLDELSDKRLAKQALEFLSQYNNSSNSIILYQNFEIDETPVFKVSYKKHSNSKTKFLWIYGNEHEVYFYGEWNITAKKVRLAAITIAVLSVIGIGAVFLITPQIYAYNKYKDFPLYDPGLLIQRISSSSFLERNITGDELFYYSRIKFNSDGTVFSSQKTEEIVDIWNFNTGVKIKSFSVEELRPPTSRLNKIIGVNLDLKYLLTNHDKEIKIWNTDNGKLVRSLNVSIPNYKIKKILVSDNYRYAVVLHSSDINDDSGSYPKVILWDLENGKMVRSFGDESRFISVYIEHFTSDGEILIFSERKFDPSFRKVQITKIWNSKTGEETIVEMVPEKDSISPPSFSVIGSNVAENILLTFRGLNELEIRQLDTGKLLRVNNLYRYEQESIKISPDGKLFIHAPSPSSKIEIYNSNNGKTIHNLLSNIGEFTSLQFSPDSKMLAIRSKNNYNIDLYNLETGKIYKSFIDAPNSNSVLSFTPDGKFLLTSSKKGIRVWRVH